VAKQGLYANIHAKRKRGEKMRKPGQKGAPTDKAPRPLRRERRRVPKTPAWTRKEGKNPAGGLNAKGRASYKGGTLKAPVKSGDNPRRASFLARMGNMPGPERDSKGRPTRLLLSLQAWGASSKADARAKAKAISARNNSKKA